MDGIDELVAARLRANAVRAGAEAQAIRARGRRRRRFVRGATVAAAVLVAVAIVAILTRGNSHETKASSSGTPVTVPSSEANLPAPSQRAATLGSYPDVQSLMAAVSDSARRDSVASNGAQRSTAGGAFGPAAQATGSGCATQFDRLGGTGEPVVDSSALVAGRPVYVRVYVQPHETLVVVLTSDCRLLARRAEAR